MSLGDLDGTDRHGENRLWMEPGPEVRVSEATARVDGADVYYTWSFDGQQHEGTITVAADGSALWVDTFHQPTPMVCHAVAGPGALVAVLGAYAPPNEDWHWRTLLSLRPTGELVLQMTNVPGRRRRRHRLSAWCSAGPRRRPETQNGTMPRADSITVTGRGSV